MLADDLREDEEDPILAGDETDETEEEDEVLSISLDGEDESPKPEEE